MALVDTPEEHYVTVIVWFASSFFTFPCGLEPQLEHTFLHLTSDDHVCRSYNYGVHISPMQVIQHAYKFGLELCHGTVIF